MANRLVQFSPKFCIDPESVRAIAPVKGSGQMFMIFTDRHSVQIEYNEYRKLKQYMLDNGLMIVAREPEGSNENQE